MWEGVGDRTELQHIDPHSIGHNCVSFLFSWAAEPGAWGPTLLGAGFLYCISSPTGLVSKLTDFLSSPSYIIVQSPTQYLPITGHRDVSLPLSLEWHVWLSSSGNNCHAVHRSLSFGASIYDCTAGFYLVLFCQPSLPTPMEYALPLSLEWHVWLGRRSIYNRCTTRTLTKRLVKKLDGNCTRMLWAILNKSWKKHLIKHPQYSHLPPISKVIQIKRKRHAGYCWMSKDEHVSDVLTWTP